MARPELILIFLLQFKAGISGNRFLYYRLGNDVTLPCDDVPSSETRCSLFTWFHDRNTGSQITFKVVEGKIDQNLPGADRLSLSRNCSLIINNITAEDAGHYVCRIRNDANDNNFVYLNILTISPSPPDADPKADDEVTLKCSLLRFGSCPQNRIRWVDEKGTVLRGEGDGFKFNGQTDCVSLLTVKRQSGHNNRRYTCQFIERNIVKIDAHYSPVFTEVTSNNTIMIVSVVVGMLVVLVVITAVLITCRRRAKMTEDVQKRTQAQDEPGGNLTYVTINHANYNPKTKVKVKEEAVTYSTIKTTVKMEADSDPSSFYSSVR